MAHVVTQREGGHLGAIRCFSPDTEAARALILDFPAYVTVRDASLWFPSPVVDDGLLQRPKLTETAGV